MTDSWRVKKYYSPRVLIATEDVLTPPFPDCMLCLTGGQRDIVMNLLQYARRRSTFVSDNQVGYYLCPTNAEWDELQAILADLEYKMATCDDFTSTMAQILANAQTAAYQPNSALISDLVGDGILDWYADWSDGSTVVDEERCAIACLAFQWGYETLTETVFAYQDAIADALLVLAAARLALIIINPVLGIPASAIIAGITGVARVIMEGEQTDLANRIWSLKDEIVCTIYDSLDTGTYGDAENAIGALFDAQVGLSIIDRWMLRGLFGVAAMGIGAQAYADDTQWAQDNVDTELCGTCETAEETEFSFTYVYNTLCTPLVLLSGATCELGIIRLNANNEKFLSPPTMFDVESDYTLRITAAASSTRSAGYRIASPIVEYSNNGTDWVGWGDGDQEPDFFSTGAGMSYYDSGELHDKGGAPGHWFRIGMAKGTNDGYTMDFSQFAWTCVAQ